MHREYHSWHSNSLNRNMELLVFGHGGARVIVFPTSMGRFFDWENRGFMGDHVLGKHIKEGWLQVYCVDSVDNESWYNNGVGPEGKADRHMQYHKYIIDEVLPFSEKKNANPFVIATGASFGGYHAINIGLRYPEKFGRVLGMSGLYDMSRWTNGHMSESIHQSNPVAIARHLGDSPKHLESLKKVDIIFPVGVEDQAHPSNVALSNLLWERGVWHAFRTWDGFAHDWPEWEEMLRIYIGGPETKG